METRDIPETTPVPGIIKILGEGCNLIANRVYLMAAPILLDLFLLFGPKLRINEYFRPYLTAAFKQVLATATAGKQQLEMSVDLLMRSLESVNLFSFLQTFPIGIRAIASGETANPLGNSAELQLTSLLQILPFIALMIGVGILLGTLYYSVVSAACAKQNGKFTWKKLGTQLLNVILLYIAIVVVMFILSIPFSCIMVFSFMISPVIYQFFILIMLVLSCWVIIPLFFIPQAIFMKDLDLPHAVKHSFTMASWAGTLIIRYILLSLVLTFGLDMIWTIPDQSSWLVLVSIFGHAFVSTALLASSFILFRELDQWQTENKSFLEWRKANLRIMQLLKKEPETHE